MNKIGNVDEYWSELYDQGRDFRLMTSEELTRLLSYADDPTIKSCLDIGCGTGQLTRELYHRGYSSVGIDASTSAIRIARSLTIVSNEQIQYTHMNIERDDLSALLRRGYALITCKLTYAFIEDKAAFLERVRRMLIPNGRFIVITPRLEDAPIERRDIAVNNEHLRLLSACFKEVALYKDHGLTYFIGL